VYSAAMPEEQGPLLLLRNALVWMNLLRNRRHITVVFSTVFHYNGAWPLGTSYSRAVGPSRTGRSGPWGCLTRQGSLSMATVETGPFCPDPCRSLDGGTLWHLAHGPAPLLPAV